MGGGTGNDSTVDSSVSPEDAVDLDLPATPQPPEVSRFDTEIKGKAKVSGSSHDPELEAVNIAGAKSSTELSGAGLRSDGTDQAVGECLEVYDSDDVVREISVFCASGNLGEDTQLYVVQHVLREARRPYELNKRLEEVRLNPEQLKIEIDLRFEEEYQEIPEPPRLLKLKKQTLSSTVVSSGIQYAVGFLEKNKFHLNPVHAILQLRPSFASLDDELRKNEESVSKTTEASTETTKPWVLLQYHPIDSSISNEIKHKMAVEPVQNEQFMMIPDFYHLSLEDRLTRWFCKENQVNSFDVLKDLACGYSEDNLLKVLPSYAKLVQGLWVCKSSLLYRDPEAIQRDYILLRFLKKYTIKYHELEVINLNPSVFQCMMVALAYDREFFGDWKFKKSTDLSFIKRYQNIVQEQQNAWSVHEKIIMDSLPFTNRDKGSIQSFVGQSMSSETREHLPRALLEIFKDKRVLSLQSIVRGLRKLGLLYKSSGPREYPKINAAAHAVSAPVEELCSIIDQVAVRIHGVYALKSVGNPALDPLRNVVIMLYQGKGPNAKLRKKEIKVAGQSSLSRDISDSEYNQFRIQVLHELCVWREGWWELKSGE